MICITKTKKIKKYQMPEMLNSENIRAKVLWLRIQQKRAAIHNIKSVSVQVRDIKHMIYSNNPRLISMYAKFWRNNKSSLHNDDDYITIRKTTNLNKDLMYALISADWLLDVEIVENKSIEELQQDFINLQNKIYELKERKKQLKSNHDIEHKIKLLEYKLSCISEIILNKVNLKNDLNKNTTVKVLLKNKINGGENEFCS